MTIERAMRVKLTATITIAYGFEPAAFKKYFESEKTFNTSLQPQSQSHMDSNQLRLKNILKVRKLLTQCRQRQQISFHCQELMSLLESTTLSGMFIQTRVFR